MQTFFYRTPPVAASVSFRKVVKVSAQLSEWFYRRSERVAKLKLLLQSLNEKRKWPWYYGVVVITTLQTHLTKSAQIKTLLAACQRFAMVGSLTMVPARNKAKRLSSISHTIKTIHHHHCNHHHQGLDNWQRKIYKNCSIKVFLNNFCWHKFIYLNWVQFLKFLLQYLWRWHHLNSPSCLNYAIYQTFGECISLATHLQKTDGNK